jgi:hypothetical protein
MMHGSDIDEVVRRELAGARGFRTWEAVIQVPPGRAVRPVDIVLERITP